MSQTAHCRITGGALKITNQPDNVYCAIGGSASLTVAATGTGLSCRWQYSPDGGKTWHNSTNGTATYATLYIGEVTEYLMGMVWRCKVMDSSGNVEYSRAVYLKRNTTLWTNTYNSDGLRVSRTNGESTYNYTYLNGQLTHLTVDGHTMYFYYGADGTPMALSFNGVRYYYVTSLTGDITAIVDQTGTVVTTYLYDAWGNHLHTTGSLSATVGRYNPLRYRGYVYDRETKLYYLQSRYYNPETGRFINGDGFTTTGQGVIGNNMFAYCNNNPVCFSDPTGICPHDGKFYTNGPFKGQFEYNSGCASCKPHGEFWLVHPIYGQIDAVQNPTLLNACIVYDYLTCNGASHSAASAILGNMHHESGIDPGKHQNGGGPGYGLVQWDPASKYTDWAAENGYSDDSLYGQLEFLLYSMQPGQGEWLKDRNYSGFYLSCNSFMTSDASVEYLTKVFCYSYERPGIPHMQERINYALYWYNYFG